MSFWTCESNDPASNPTSKFIGKSKNMRGYKPILFYFQPLWQAFATSSPALSGWKQVGGAAGAMGKNKLRRQPGSSLLVKPPPPPKLPQSKINITTRQERDDKNKFQDSMQLLNLNK